jgi:hypothetical protein
MAPRPQAKPQPEPGQPGLKVVEKPSEASTPAGQAKPAAEEDLAANQARQSEAAARRRLHPARVWPD